MDQQTSTPARSAGLDVMVSYSSQDREAVMRIVQRLRAAGVSVWIDYGGIDGAQRWGEEIVDAIEACKTVVLMVSRVSMQSTNIAKEVTLASEGGKHFLPLYLEEATIPRSMQYPLAGIHYLKLYEGDPERNFTAVLRALVRLGVRVSPYYIALLSADGGDREQAFEWLNRACEQRSGSLARLQTEERFKLLRGDPRFDALVQRVATLTLESEETIAEMPVLKPRAVQYKIPTGPQALWKKLLWPDIYDDVSARQATALGIWACALSVAFTVFALIYNAVFGPIAVPGLGLQTPIFFAIILSPIAFGMQKMGRPAALIGAVLSGFGLLGNFGMLQAASMGVDAYSKIPEQFRNPYTYPSPYPTYFYAWFSVLTAVVCVTAFINASRGTLAYHEMVVTGRAIDKQDAITRDDWFAIKTRAGEVLPRTSAPTPKPTTVTGPVASPAQVAPPQLAVDVKSEPVISVEPKSEVAPIIVPPKIVRKVFVPSFRDMIGADGASIINFPRAGIFLLATVLASLAALLASSYPIRFEYWLLAACQAAVFAIIAILAFRFLRNAWLASGVTAIAVTLLGIPFFNLLWTFVPDDLMYREQFQEFVLLPFVHTAVFILGLVLLLKSLRQLPVFMTLWGAAIVTEVVTTLVGILLRSFGAGQSPDLILADSSIMASIVRSTVFAFVLWAGLKYLQSRRPGGSRVE